MKLKHNPFPFIFTQGDKATKLACLEFFGLSDSPLLLSWLLDQLRRIQSTYNVSDPRIKRMMETLIGIQREDGGWHPFWSEESSPVYTALAVKVLILSGMLARKDLEAAINAYTT